MPVLNQNLLMRGVALVSSFFRPSSVVDAHRTKILVNFRETSCNNPVYVNRPYKIIIINKSQNKNKSTFFLFISKRLDFPPIHRNGPYICVQQHPTIS